MKPSLNNDLQPRNLIRLRSAKLQAERNEEKSAKKVNPNVINYFFNKKLLFSSLKTIQLQLDTESAQFHADQNFMTFRYTIPNEINFPGNLNPQSHLCEHHRKKLSDLFLLKNLASNQIFQFLKYMQTKFIDYRPLTYLNSHLSKSRNFPNNLI